MKTNITYSPRAVMALAWSIRKESAQRFSCKVSEIIMSDCLKLAWRMVKGGSSIIDEYNAKTADEMNRWLKNACHKYSKIEIGKSEGSFSYDSRLEQPAFDWYGFAENHLDDMAQQAWVFLCDKLSDSSYLDNLAQAGKGLTQLVYNAARSGVRRVLRNESHNVHVAFSYENSKGEEFSILDIFKGESCTSHTSHIASDAELSNLVCSFAETLNSKNREVFGYRLQGLTEREIGEKLGVSGVAIHKRIDKIKAALREYLAA